MKAIGFIPLRRNSKGIKGKNKRKMLGRPLFCWVLLEAVLSELDEVFIFTDDDAIKEFINNQYSWTSKIKVLDRKIRNASDQASTEAAISEFCEKVSYDFNIFCLLQATSPLVKREEINNALRKVKMDKDSVLSVVRSHRFTWSEKGIPLNYDYRKRPRRQDFNGHLVENGAIYCTTKDALQSSGNRISGEIGVLEMPEQSYYEVDSLADWTIIEELLLTELQRERIPGRITHLFLDVDGVFTDGKVFYSESGELAKVFDMRDGMGLEILREDEIEVSVITSENSALVAERMKKLKIDTIHLGVKDKFALLQHLSQSQNFDLNNAAFLGDDVNDIACMAKVGWSFCPADGMEEAKKIADINLTAKAGSGAIREACRFITKYNKRF